jgi:O-antigen/teichoic acid export membrane protein
LRTTNAIFISLASLFTLLIRTIMNFLLIRYFIESYGNEMNGLIATIRQMLEYLNILDGGVGVAIIAMLVGPIAKKDHNAINKIVSSAFLYYKRIGVFFFICLSLLGLFYANIANQEIETSKIFWLIVLAGGINLSNFFIAPGYNYFLIASQKEYIIHILNLISFGVGPLLMIVLMNYGCDVYTVRAVPVVMGILVGVLTRYYTQKKFPWLKVDTNNTLKLGNQARDTIIHQIAGLVIFNTDMIILSIATGFAEVSIYSIYLSIFFMVKNILAPIIASGRIGLGELLSEGNMQKVNDVFSTYEYVSFLITFIFLTALSIISDPFIKIYADGLNGLKYVDPLLSKLFVIVFLLDLIRNPHQAMISIAGHFKQTKYRAVFEAILKVLFSVLLVHFYGIYGVLLGTIISYSYRVIDIIWYNYSKILKTDIKRTIGRLALNVPTAIMLYIICSKLYPEISGFGEWLIYSSLFTACIGVVFILLNFAIEQKPLIDFLRRIRLLK